MQHDIIMVRIPGRYWMLGIVAILGSSIVAEATASEIQSYTLPNGLVVVLYPTDRFQDVTVYLSYNVGTVHDPLGLTGVSQVTQKMTSEAPLPASFAVEWRKALRSTGGTSSGYTDQERTSFTTTVSPALLKAALWVEAWRMTSSGDVFDNALLRSEHLHVSRSRRFQAIGPNNNLTVDASEVFYPDRRAFGEGTVSNVIDLGAVRAFRTHWYAPANAILVVAGKFDTADARSAIDTYFGVIPARTPGVAKTLPLPQNKGEIVIRTIQPAGRLPAVKMLWLTPSHYSKVQPVGDIAAQILGGLAASRLEALCDLFVSIEVEHDTRFTTSWFTLTVELDAGINPDEFAAKMEGIIDKLRTQPPSQGEVDAAVRRLLLKTQLELDTSKRMASSLSVSVPRNGTRHPMEVARDAYAAVRPIDVQRFAITHLARSRRVTVTARQVANHAAEGDVGAKVESTP